MHVLSVGLNHSSAPLEIRERAAVTAETLPDALKDLTKHHAVSEAAILSTCNRTEVYCHLETPQTNVISDWLCEYHALQKSDISPFLYQFPDQHAVKHAFRVASGMDSMVIGEPQILGQMKTAFATAHRQGTTGKVLNKLFQNTFSVAKRIRSTTAIGHNAVSVAYAAVALSKQIFTDITEKTVLLIGAGETIELVCSHLYNQGIRKIVIANRSMERTGKFVTEFGADPIGLHELPDHLSKADMVFSSTASTLPIVGKGAIESALRERKQKSMFLVDLAVPRDIEPEVGTLKNAYLYTVDDLEQVVSENIESRHQAVDQAEKIVEAKSVEFMLWLDSLQSIPTLRDLRSKTAAIKTQQLDQAQRRLLAGDDPEDVLNTFAHALTQKFMHDPSEWLKQQNNEERFALARTLFGLDGHTSNSASSTESVTQDVFNKTAKESDT